MDCAKKGYGLGVSTGCQYRVIASDARVWIQNGGGRGCFKQRHAQVVEALGAGAAHLEKREMSWERATRE